MEPINGIARDLFPYPQHRATAAVFFNIVAPQVRPVIGHQLGNAMANGKLTEEQAATALIDLWADDRAWRASEPPLA